MSKLEQRQLRKIEPIERPSLAGVDPKIARSLIRSYNKELKLRQEAQYLDTAKEIGLGTGAAIVYSGGQIAKTTIEGIFDVIGKIAGNDNPIVFGLEAVTAVTILVWFNEAFPDVSKFFHLNTIPKFINSTGDELNKAAAGVLGRNDQTGTLGIAELDPRGYYITNKFRWYTNSLSRDAAYAFLTLSPEDVKRFVLVERIINSAGSTEAIIPDSPGFIRDHKGKWAVVWVLDSGPSQGQETIVGYWPDALQAQSAADAYNKAYNRNAFVRQV